MKLILTWFFVVISLGWGVMKSVQKAAPLFQQAPANSTR